MKKEVTLLDILTEDKLVLFFVLFMPGFVSTIVFRLIFPGEKLDVSKSLFEIIGFSFFNYAFFFSLLYPLIVFDFPENHPVWFGLVLLLVMFIAPLYWPFLWQKATEWPFLKNRIIHPTPKPWDYVFSKRKSHWVIVHMKDGTTIAGIYSKNSFTSSFPVKEQIYLEQLWTLDGEGKFNAPVVDSEGIIILGDEIMAVELFKYQTDNMESEEHAG